MMRLITDRDRDEAVARGIEFFCDISERHNLNSYGFDILFCFNLLTSSMNNKSLRRRIRGIGRERACLWLKKHSTLPSKVDADTIVQLAFGCYASRRLGLRVQHVKSQLRSLARTFTSVDYFWFDPDIEPPPRNIPEQCDCGRSNERGTTKCVRCDQVLRKISRYEVWLLALIRTYLGERQALRLGSSYTNVLRWIRVMRPYPSIRNGYTWDFIWSIYSVTHVVFTLTDYGLSTISPSWLNYEFRFLKSSVQTFISKDDPETLGEIVFALKCFGLCESDFLVQKGMQYLIFAQNADGSWGDVKGSDYERFHSTVTALTSLIRCRRRKRVTGTVKKMARSADSL